MKFKFYEEATVVVTQTHKTKRSVFFGAYDKAVQLQSLGRVTIPPNQEIPEVGQIIEVRYLYAYKNGSLYQPTFKMVRTDQQVKDCLTSGLKYKPEVASFQTGDLIVDGSPASIKKKSPKPKI